MNIPYVKKYNELGQIMNPIKGSYLSTYPNRRQRRLKPDRFHNNRMEVDSRPVQWIKSKTKSLRKILHKLIS